MIISLGCDKAGTPFVERFCKELTDRGIEYKVLFDGKEDGCDYTDAAFAVAKSVAGKESDLGILICGTGIGMSIAANKIKGIRAAVCSDTFSAKMTRVHNDANIMCVGARVIGEELAVDILHAFLDGEFEKGGRHERRVCKIIDAENGKF
ncbi:MAG: ribose 5-phosphate isomerase B [Clostridia bacterium]|nr:ribose 5-phosphate isomerase B [Clostridia bacterium]